MTKPAVSRHTLHLAPASPAASETPTVAVIGIGYVGTHLVEAFSQHYPVIGYDISSRRIDQLRDEFRGKNGASDRSGAPDFTTSKSKLAQATHFLISVPTLLRDDKTVDSSYLESALETVSAHARPGVTVVIESSVAIGMTRSLLGPICTAKGIHGGMSPERVDPGRTCPPTTFIPKLISGLDAPSLRAILDLYTPVFETLIPVSNPEVAEMTKLYENCQRMVNIAFTNEMADACLPHGIDPYEVASAAATKPFGFMDFRPSVGVGGHCIPVNPWYLLGNCEFPLLKKAAETMASRPEEIAKREVEKLEREVVGRRTRVLVVGIGFKKGQGVVSYSPGVALARALAERGVDVMWADPLVEQEVVPEVQRLEESEWGSQLVRFDVIIVVVKQIGLDFGVLDRLEGVRIEMWA